MAVALPGIEEPRKRLWAAVDELPDGEPGVYVLAGPQASGRRVLLQRLAEHVRGRGLAAFELEILPFGHDTPAQVLLHIAALAPATEHAQALTTLATSWRARLDAAEAILNSSAASALLVHFPAGAMPADERADRQLQQETADIVKLVTRPRPRTLIAIAAQPWWRWPHEAPITRILLASSSQSREFLSDASRWGSLRDSAAELARLLGARGDAVSPLQLRLGVALLATGTRPSIVAEALAPGAVLRDLERPLRHLLERRPELAAAVARVARARTAVDAAVLEDVACAGPEWELVSRCFLYEDGPGRLRFHDQLRWLVPDDSPETSAHAKLCAYYRSVDGATSPAEGLRRVAPWLEKLHHASRADADGAVDQWLELNPPSREHYWEYGWSLSKVHGRYVEAARVYRELLSRLPGEDDNYAQHYYAFNLDRAGEDPVTAEVYYQKAVQGDPTNAWWSSRFISFLTERGRFEAARKAWSAALEVIDPTGDRSGDDWLPYHLHKHVIQAGLDSGNLELADVAHRAIRPPAASSDLFQWLRVRIDAALQVRRLGEALFPAHVSLPEWWRPRLLRARHGEELREWRAGRVLHVTHHDVSVALGYRPAPGDDPVVEYQVFARAEWNAVAPGQEPREGDFFEAALIDGKRRLESECPEEAAVDQPRLTNLLRYVSTRAWLP